VNSNATSQTRLSLPQALIATWGVVGVLGLLGQASYRLGGRAVEAISSDLTQGQLATLLLWTAFNLYAEGYRAFQKRFSPRVVVRAFHLARHPNPLHVTLAPFYCMALLHSAKRERIVAWSTIVMIMGFILLLRHVPQPWRGIVDAGVVVALLWGAAAIVALHTRALVTGAVPDFPPGLPADVALNTNPQAQPAKS
jgi:hypothetical protein